MARLIPELTDRQFRNFISKVDFEVPEGSCWNWHGTKDPFGYGNFRIGKDVFRAHRVAYSIAKEQPKDLDVLHKCDNPSCVNPSHHFLGTDSDNQKDAIRKGRFAWSNILKKGEECYNAKLNAAKVKTIRFLLKSGHTQPSIAKLFGVSRSAILGIHLGRCWRHIPLVLMALFLCFSSKAQSNLRFALTDPSFGISQTVNATVTLQAWSIGQSGQIVLLPVPLQQITDGTGTTIFSNLFGSPISGFYHWNVSPSNSSQRVQGNAWIQNTNLGTVNESIVDLVNGAPNFPAGTWSWSAQASDLRYAASSNSFNLGNVTNIVTSLAFTNQLAPGANITFVTNNRVVTISSTSGSGNGNYNSNQVLFAADIYATNGATITGSGAGITNIPPNQRAFGIATNLPASGVTNLTAFTSSGEFGLLAQSLPFYDIIGTATNLAYQLTNFVNSQTVNAVTNTQNNVTFGNLNLSPWLITAQTFGSSALVISNSSGGILVYIRTNGVGLTLFAITNLSLIASNGNFLSDLTAKGNISTINTVSGSNLVSSGNVTGSGNGTFGGTLTSAHNTLDDGSGNITASQNITWQDGQLNGGGITVSGAGNVTLGTGEFNGSGAGLSTASVPIAAINGLLTLLLNGTNNTAFASNVVQQSVILTNGIIQAQITATTNGLNTLIINSTNGGTIASILNTNRFLQANITRNDGSLVTNLSINQLSSTLTTNSPGSAGTILLAGYNSSGQEVFVNTNALPYATSSGGGSTPNAYLTNVPNAFPNVTAPNSLVLVSNLTAVSNITAQTFVLTNGTFIGTYQPSNVNIGESGIPFIRIQNGAYRNGHIVIGSTNNFIPADPNFNDDGVGIFGSDFSFISDSAGDHMVGHYVFGGYSNYVFTSGDFTGNTKSTNEAIVASAFSAIGLNNGTANSMRANDNIIVGSRGSTITNIFTSNLGVSVNNNMIIHGSNSAVEAVINGTLNGAFIIGRNATVTNSDAYIITDGAANPISGTNNQLFLSFANGVGVGTNGNGTNAFNVFGNANATSISTPNLLVQNQTQFGGHPYQTLSGTVLGVTNFSGNLIPANGTYIQVSSTLWLDTNNAVYSILTNGASCLIQSNGITVATAGAVINGSYTITAPGSGNNPGVEIGSIIDETSVLHIGPANFTNLNAINATILNGAVSNLTVGTLSASVLNASSALTSAHVSVSTNGWGYAGFWTNETSGAQALQDAINSGTNLLQVWTNVFAFTFTTNSCGLDIEVGPGIYYRPQGWTIPNQCAVAGWHIHGQGFPNTYLVGDSNIIKNYTNYTGFGGYAGPLPFEQIDHIGLVVSNYTQKTFAIDLRGNGYLDFGYNWANSYVSIITSNMANGWIGGDTPGNYLPSTYKPGIILMVDDGQTGDQWIHNNIFSGGAAGLICVGEHQRLEDNEWKQMSGISSPFTNLWMTNDSTVVLTPDTGVNLLGGQIGVGASVYIIGSGDTSMTGDKFLGGGVGVFVSGIHNGSQYYGPVVLHNLHFENMNRPSMGDVVIANGSDGSTFPSTVVTYDCVDQQSADGSMQAWTYDTVSHVISQNFNDVVAPSYVTSFAVENTSGFQSYLEYRVNNQQVFTIQTDNNDGSNIVFNANWPMIGNGLALTNLQVTNLVGFSKVVNPVTIGTQWVNTNRFTGTLFINYLLTDSSISGSPGLNMTNKTSGQWFVATNAFVLSAPATGQAAFKMAPGDVFISGNGSSGSASAAITGSYFTP